MKDTPHEWGRALRRIRFDEARRNECNTSWDGLSPQRQRSWTQTALRFARWIKAPWVPVYPGGGDAKKPRRRMCLFFAWFDFWVGWYYDRERCTLYVCLLPMVVLAFDFGRRE